MKSIYSIVFVACLSAVSLIQGCGAESEKKPPVKEQPAKAEKPAEPAKPADPGKPAEQNAEEQDPAKVASYNMGLRMGLYVYQNRFNGLDIEAVKQGLEDGSKNEKPRYTEQQMKDAMAKIQEMRQQEKMAQAQKNIEIGEKYLAENGKREGVVTIESGIQYEIITEGKGPKPKETDTVKTHYRGTLIDGKQFDSSYDRGQPATFPLNRVIPGWTEVLQLMGVGSKWKVHIPAKLAYGERSPSPAIPANSVLVFDIELLEIVDNKPKAKPETKPADAKAEKKAEPAKK